MKKTNKNKKIYYVYSHVDPETHKILYIGKGVRGRAWMYDNWQWGSNRDKFRDLKHSKRLYTLVNKGYLPCDWVKIIKRNLTSKAALDTEKSLIHKHSPKFNRKVGQSKCKLSRSNLKQAIQLRNKGWSLLKLSNKYKIHTGTLWTAMYNPCKIYKEYKLNAPN